MKDSLSLLDAIHAPLCRLEYQPKEGVTHCSGYVAEVAGIMGFKDLDMLLANEIVTRISQNPQWSEIPMEKAQDLANGGSLIVAGVIEEPHGHVVIVCPGKIKNSGRWGNVPTVANVGKEVWIGKGVNWAFSSMPKFWVWRKTL